MGVGRENFIATARRHGRRIAVPYGALAGLGVSGSEMPDAIVHSLMMHVGGRPGLCFG